jgi:hypothetical protein
MLQAGGTFRALSGGDSHQAFKRKVMAITSIMSPARRWEYDPFLDACATRRDSVACRGTRCEAGSHAAHVMADPEEPYGTDAYSGR